MLAVAPETQHRSHTAQPGIIFKWHLVRSVPFSVSAGAATAQKYLTSLMLDYLTDSTIVLFDLKWFKDESHTEASDSMPHDREDRPWMTHGTL